MAQMTYQHRPLRLVDVWAGVMLLLAMAAVPAAAQDVAEAPEAQAPPEGLNPESFYGRDPRQGVYVRDSAVALERFTLAQRMERLREWHTSADVYQEILERFSDRVVPSQIDETNQIYQYQSVTLAVQERLARWPAEGLRVYRARYESAATELLEQAGPQDYATLHQIYSLYFVTDSGKSAGIRLMDMYMEAGEFPAAAWVGERLLKWHPELSAERPMVLYRTALAQHLGGETAAAGQWMNQLQQHHPQATGTIAGREVTLTDSLQEKLQIDPPTAQIAAGDSWPMFGGSPDRSRISPATGRPGARLGSADYAQPTSYRGASLQQRQELATMAERHRQSGSTLGVMPVVDDGILYFQDNAHVYAVNLESGLPLSSWVAARGGVRRGRYTLPNASSMPPGRQFTLTVTDDAVLAVMGQPDPTPTIQGQPRDGESTTRLVSLDRHNGEPRWIISPRQLPEEPTALRALSFSGSPLVVGDSVYVIGRGGRGMQFEDSYILCFDRDSGEYRWSCYIASGSTGNPMWRGEMGLTTENVSHLAYSGGRVYILTNLGAVSAIDAYSGTIIWLSLYPRDQAEMDPRMGRLHMPGGWRRPPGQEGGRPWTYDAVVVRDGKVFVLPSDGRHVLIYDAGTGEEYKRIERSHLADADTLLGVVDEKLIAAGSQRVICLNWRTYDPEAFRSNNREAIIWASSNLPQVRGRGFVTTETVFIPTEERLYQLELSGGRVREYYPGSPRTWEADEGPGNVLVAQDHVILAGDRRVNIYTDMNLARQKLDREIAAAPADPAPRLRYAEMMFVAGEPDLALEKLDQAIYLLGGINALRPDEQRNRVFSMALTFAHRLGSEGGAQSAELAGSFFDRAGAAAADPQQQVHYRITRAGWVRVHDPADAVALYQQILDDPRLRQVPVAEETSESPAPAATVAQRAITALIARAGADVYQPFEEQAAAALAAARAQNDPEALLAVAQRYPNAGAAGEAMMVAAEVYEMAGDPRAATQILRQLHFRYPEAPSRARIIEALARNYLAMPNRLDVAAARLEQGAKLGDDLKLTRPLVLPDGRTLEDVTFAQALQAVREHRDRTIALRLPDLALPSHDPEQPRRRMEPFMPGPAPVISDVLALVEPLREFPRHDRIVTWSSDDQLAIFAVGETTPMAASDALSSAPMNLAWLEEGLLVWNERQIALLDADDAELRWMVDLQTLPDLEVVAGEGILHPQEQALNADAGDDLHDVAEWDVRPGDQRRRQVIFHGNQQIVIEAQILPDQEARQRELAALEVLQRVRMGDGEPVEPDGEERFLHLRPVDQRLLAATSSGRLLAIDTVAGEPAWQMRLTRGRPIDRLLASDDFAVVRFSEQGTIHLLALDAFSGEMISRRTFNAATAMQPLNLALAPDGTLVYTMPDRLCGKDLYEPGDDLKFEVPRQAADQPVYVGAVHPEQLLIADGRIITVEQGGRFVSLHSLQTGQMLRHETGGREIDSMLNATERAETMDPHVTLRTVGPYLYIIGRRSLMAYNLDRIAEDSWSGTLDGSVQTNIREAIIGPEFLLLLDDRSGPAIHEQPAGSSSRNWRLHAYWLGTVPDRQTDQPKQSGLIVHSEPITHPAGITHWQAVDGGLYYLTADRKLHLLRGAGDPGQ